MNSMIVAGTVAIFNVTLATLAAYGFSRYRMRGQDFLQVLLLIARLFPVVVMSIALFRIAGILKVYDTYLPIILVNAVINLPFAIWSLRAAMDAIPIELEEAAWIDGCSRIQTIIRIISPLIAPAAVATAAFVFLLSWNEYLFALTFIRSQEKMLMTVTMANNIQDYHMNYAGLMAHAMIASVPILVMFLFMQRRIVSGLVAGAFK
jgi:ABC-type glycerol-3-phosphate transport system permease component